MAAVSAAASFPLARPARRLPIFLARRPRRTFASTTSLQTRIRDRDKAKAKDTSSNSLPSEDEAEALRRSAAASQASSRNSVQQPPMPQRGTLGSGSIFGDADEDTTSSLLTTTNQRVPRRKQAPAPAPQGALPTLEERAHGNLEQTLNPNPRSRDLWLRRKVIQAVQRRGKLTREEKLARTERTSVTRSHWFKTSLKKLGPLARQITGKSIDDAILQMRFSPKKAARDVRDFLEHARNEAVVARGMGVSTLRQQERQKSLNAVRLKQTNMRLQVERIQLRIAELQRLLGDLSPEKQPNPEPIQGGAGEVNKAENSVEAPTSSTTTPVAEVTKPEKETVSMAERQQMTPTQTKQRWQEEEARGLDSKNDKVIIPAAERDSPGPWLQDQLDTEQQNLTNTQEALERLAHGESALDKEIRKNRPQAVDIVLKNKQQVTITDPGAIYIAQAWVNRGPFGKALDHRAKGRVNLLRLPHTALSVVLKEEHTRIREAREREEKEARLRKKNVWVQLPDRKIFAQRQHYCW